MAGRIRFDGEFLVFLQRLFINMLQPIFRTLLQPSVARVSYSGLYVLRSVPNCFVRYKKNPWSPLAPTKLFLVKEHNIKDPKEMKELAILDEHYKTAMKALRYILFSIICTAQAAASFKY